MTAWNLIVDPPLNGGRNMERDRSLLELAEAAPEWLPTLRLYAWSEPTVSLGFHQDPGRAVDLSAVERLGIPIVRRPTGGRAVLHADEVTYAVVAALDTPFGTSVDACYRPIAEALMAALIRIGVPDVTMARGEAAPASRGDSLVAPCARVAGRLEILSRRRKLVGSAQKRGRRAFLQHGSIPLRLNRSLLRELTGFAVDAAQAVGVAEASERGSPPSSDDLKQALIDGFSARFGARFQPALALPCVDSSLVR